MATDTILFLTCIAIGLPIIWRLMWREDFDGMRSDDRLETMQ
jgi:hypothetical protein